MEEVMTKLIAYCGYDCSKCPVYIASDKDKSYKKDIAEKMSNEQYRYTTRDICCSGCTDLKGKCFKYCRECQIRLCGIKNKVKNCALCSSYPCDKIEELIERSPKAGEALENIRREFLKNF